MSNRERLLAKNHGDSQGLLHNLIEFNRVNAIVMKTQEGQKNINIGKRSGPKSREIMRKEST